MIIYKIYNFSLDGASTNISNYADEIINSNDEESMDKRIDFIIDNGIKRWKQNKVNNYIDKNIKVKNYFPEEPKYLKRNDNKNEIEDSIFNISSKLSKLNDKAKEFNKKNKEKDSKIELEMNEDNNEEKEEEMIIE